jgi:hypothetical protein
MDQPPIWKNQPGQQGGIMKTAVFQINQADGSAYLVCLRMSSLQAACALERWLRMQAAPGKEVTLLGRFDAVHAALGQDEAEALILSSGRQAFVGAVFTVEELVDRVLSR